MYNVFTATYQDVRPITVNGVRLDTLAHNVSSKIGLANAAGLRGANPTPAGRDGSIWTRGKRRNEGALSISMWASPLTEAGARPVSKEQAYDRWRTNMDKILALFDSSNGLLDVRQQTGPGVNDYRQAWCEMVDGIDPSGMQPFSEFQITLKVPGVFWQDIADSTFTSLIGTSAIGLHDADEFAGATATMGDLTLKVTGPITNPRVTDELTGHYVQYDGIVSAGSTWTVDAARWTSDVNGVSVVEHTTSVGVFNPKLFALSAAYGATPQIRLGGSGAGSGTKLTATGRRKFR